MTNRLPTEKINEKAGQFLPACAQFLKDMISIPSTSGKEGKLIERCEREMKDVGFDEVGIDGFGNVVGRIGHGKRVIAMDAHLDTVDVGNRSLWKRDPFEPAEIDGVIYGRGASDQEAGFAAMVYGAKIIRELDLSGDYTLYMVGSVQEEDCDGLCWRYIVEKEGLKPEAVILTEPTGLAVYRGQRGRVEIEIATKGLSCHASAPERGENAIYKMAPIISDVEGLGAKLSDHPLLGKGSVTISRIRSTSPSLNAVADSASIYLDRRMTLGESAERSVGELEALPTVKAAGAEVTIAEYKTPTHTGCVMPVPKIYPPWLLEEGHPLFQAGVETARAVLGREPETGVWVFSTNGVATMGIHGIPSIGFGPGFEQHAHSPEDQVEISHLATAMGFYAAFPLVWVETEPPRGSR